MSHLNHKNIISIVCEFEDENTTLLQQYEHLQNCEKCKHNVANESAFRKYIRSDYIEETISKRFTKNVMQKIHLSQSQHLYKTQVLWRTFIFIKCVLIFFTISFFLINTNARTSIFQWLINDMSHNLVPVIYQVALSLESIVEAILNLILISILTALIFKITYKKNLVLN